jgi:hypothetical protein
VSTTFTIIVKPLVAIEHATWARDRRRIAPTLRSGAPIDEQVRESLMIPFEIATTSPKSVAIARTGTVTTLL